MKSVGIDEANAHLPELISLVEKGEFITITERGKAIALPSPARSRPERDVKAVIEEFKSYSQEARTRARLSFREIKEKIEEGRP